MKFSYTLLKKLVPGIKDRKKLVRELNLKFSETEDSGGDILDIAIPPNRFSDAASHIGIAKETAAILGLNFKNPLAKIVNAPEGMGLIKIKVKDKELCPRYGARYFKINKISVSPLWLRKILQACGLRPINNIVDIMNYAMLETGQPLHAFDADKLEKIVVRRAKDGEVIETIDGKKFKLDSAIIVVADAEKPLAIAGIKGGLSSAVSGKTRNILVEAANFDGPTIWRGAKKLGLQTDASMRFSHGLNPLLTEIGLDRATILLKELAGAELKDSADVAVYKSTKKIIEFDLARFENLIGEKISAEAIKKILKRLDFKISNESTGKFRAEPPLLRDDATMFEDLAEEVVRLYGLNKVGQLAPLAPLQIAEYADSFRLKDQVKQILTGFGLDEVHNYSLVSKKELDEETDSIAVQNPLSSQFEYLRTDLAHSLIKNLESNFRFFETVKIFEIGKVFQEGNGAKENWQLGMAIGSKKSKEPPIFELKGAVNELLGRVGLMEYFLKDEGDHLRIESDHHVIGYVKSVRESRAVAEIDLDKLLRLVEEEREYEPLPKFPAITRDISVLVDLAVRIGPIVQAIQEADLKYIEDVDLTDEYTSEDLGENKQSLTFRIIFQADDHTLTDEEVDTEMKKISRILKEKFGVEIR